MSEISEWIERAQGDFETASREFEVQTRPNYDAVCFHCQQCIEKLLKAALKKRGVDPPYLHDLHYLIKLLRETGLALSAEETEVRLLSQGAVVFRYPGERPTAKDASDIMAICGRMRGHLLVILGERLL